jgi:hypothetical protein
MDDRPRLVSVEDFFQSGGITNISTFERAPSNRPRVTFLEGIVTDWREPRFRKRLTDVAADIPGATGDQDNSAHDIPLAAASRPNIIGPGLPFVPPAVANRDSHNRRARLVAYSVPSFTIATVQGTLPAHHCLGAWLLRECP